MATPSAIYKDPNSPDLYYKQQGQEAFTKIGGPTELQNLAKGGAVEVGGQYQTYTPPTQPTTSTTPTPSLEVSPGVFNASSLKSFFDNPTTQYQKQLDTMQPQFDQATQNLADINTQLSSTKAPSYSTLYNTEYQSKVAPLDAQAGEIKSKVDTIDQSLRTLEDAVRGEIGGQAPEAIIQAEIARRAKPLQLERQGYVDQYGTIAGQRDAALQGVTQALSFAGQEYSDQLGLLKERQNIAQSAVDQYSALIEKGQAASEREIDNFRQSFSLLLQQAPDVLQNLTEEEYGQLQTGFVPQSVMTKIGDTIAQQKMNVKEKLDTSVIEAGGKKLLINNQTGDVIKVIGASRSGGSSGSGDSGYTVGVAPIGQPPTTNSAPIKTFEEYLAEKEDVAGMTFGPSKREFLRKQFNEQDVASRASTVSSVSPGNADISKFDPTVQLIILGKQKVPEASSKEYSRIKSQLLQATNLGLLDDKGKQTDTSKATADQYNSATYAERMTQAEGIFGQVANTIKGSSFMSQAAGFSSNIPTALKPSTYQQQEQAERNFVTALLRKESGAAISDTEFSSARKQYFPRAGDSDAVLAQKKENRRIAIDGMKRSAGSVGVNSPITSVQSTANKYGITY